MSTCGPPSKNKDAFYRVFPATFCVRPSIGDGSCFFHSLCAAITKGYDEMSKEQQTVAGRYLRDQFLNKMNEQLYCNTLARITRTMKQKGLEELVQDADSWSKFKNKMGNYRTWADLVIISVVGLRLQMNIVFWDSVGKQLYYGVDNFDSIKRGWPTILIEWEDRSHFNLIVEQEEKGDTLVTQRQFFWNRDSAFLQDLQRMYRKENKSQVKTQK